MGKRKWLWFENGGIALLMFFILALSITITINFRPLYVFDINYLSILDYTELDKATLLKNFGELMSYLNNPFNQTLKLSDFPMSTSGAFHFYEVKRLFLLCYGVLIATTIPSFFTIKHLVKNKRLWRLIKPFKWGMLIPVLFGFLMLVGFDQFFVSFHGIFFNNNDWLFDPATDPIINVLPEAFFMHCFVLFFILLELFLFIGVFLGKKELKKL